MSTAETEKILEEVRDFADRAHGAQMRKYENARYVVHPERVMNICRRFTDKLPVLAAALLHDVLEDTTTGREEIHEFLLKHMSRPDAELTVRLVIDLTDIYEKKNYPHLNRKKRRAFEADRLAKTDPDAQTVKYADIIDNCNEIVEKDRDFAPVFLRECRKLLQKMDGGNDMLRREAIALVEEKREGLRN